LAIIAAVFTASKFATVPQKGCRVVDTVETASEDERVDDERVDDERIGDDLLWGAIEIADELRVKPHQVNYIYKTKKLPIGKMGKQYIASKRELRKAALALTT
jgi:hypothetical protein